MVAGNYTIFKAKNVSSFKVGTAVITPSSTSALDTTVGTNWLFNFVGTRDANNPTKADAYCKEIVITAGERGITEEDLLGTDTNGAQNKEIVGDAMAMWNCEATLVMRNNNTLMLMSDNTNSALIELDNSESSTTGKINILMNNIKVKKAGDRTFSSGGGAVQEKFSFAFKGGTTTGTAQTITQSSPTAETWSRVVCGDYYEEVRTA